MPETKHQESAHRTELTGALLAGGRSRRLGRDKANLKLAGRPLALWVAERLAPLVADLWLVTNTPLEHLELGLPLVSDLLPDQGPLGGLRTALFMSRTPWVLAASVDQPFLSPALLAALARQAGRTRRAAVVFASDRGLEPFPGLYHVRLLERLADYLQSRRHVRPFLAKIRPEVLSPEPLAAAGERRRHFFNLNTPEDLRNAAAWLAQNENAFLR